MTRKLRIPIILSIVAMAGVLTLAGDREAKQKLIEEYLEVTEVDRVLEDKIRLTFASSDSFATVGLEDQGLSLETMTPEDRLQWEDSVREQSEMMRKLGEKMLAKIDLHRVCREIYGPVIDRHYSADDLRELIAFYKTPVGQKQIELQAQISVESDIGLMKVLAPLVQQAMEELQKELAEEEVRKSPWKPTMADMRSIATAVEAYHIDWDELPPALTLDDLASEITPTYLRELPRKDAWGTEFLFIVSSDKQHYRLVSAGADRSFEGDSYAISSGGAKFGPRESLDSDIVYQDGAFVAWPAASRINDH